MLAYAKVMSQAHAWMEFYRQQAEVNQRKEKTACNAAKPFWPLPRWRLA